MEDELRTLCEKWVKEGITDDEYRTIQRLGRDVSMMRYGHGMNRQKVISDMYVSVGGDYGWM